MTNVLWTSWLKPRGRASWTLARVKTIIIHRKRKGILNIAFIIPKKIGPIRKGCKEKKRKKFGLLPNPLTDGFHKKTFLTPSLIRWQATIIISVCNAIIIIHRLHCSAKICTEQHLSGMGLRNRRFDYPLIQAGWCIWWQKSAEIRLTKNCDKSA